MGMNMTVYQIVNEFKRLEEVIAVILTGSCANGKKDNYSDIDINIIISKGISVEKRESIAKKFSDNIEINNRFRDSRDEFVLRNSTIHIDISYLEFSWLEEKMQKVVNDNEVSLGYTTCLWNDVVNSIVVYDKGGKFKEFQEKYRIPYPIELKRSIINANYPILRKNISSYYNEIERAINRKDFINLNNRIVAFIDSYFDIIFAINEITHPGGKRMITIASSKCNKLPLEFKKNIEKLFKNINECNEEILDTIDIIINELDNILKDEKLTP